MGRAPRNQVSTDDPAILLRRVLEAVERGDLTAPATMTAYLAGALTALEGLGRQTARFG
jgi:hypothetical protein